MTTTTVYIASGADDWDSDSSTATTLSIRHNNSTVPNEDAKRGFLRFDTSAIPDGEIVTAATLNWYDQTYTASKGVTRLYDVRIYDTSLSGYVSGFSGTYSGSAGWKSGSFPANRLADNYISKTGYTNIALGVPDPGDPYYRFWDVRAYEYPTSPDYRAYLVVTSSVPPSTAIYVPQLMTMGMG